MGSAARHKEYTLLKVDAASVQFEEISDRDTAASLTNNSIMLPLAELKAMAAAERKTAPVQIADLWYFELVGLEVVDMKSQKPVGKISGVEEAGLNTIVTIEPAIGALLRGPLEIPLDYPHWGKVDLPVGRIFLSDWEMFE